MSNKTKFTVSEIKDARIGISSQQTIRRELKSRGATLETEGKSFIVDASELARIYTTDELDFNKLQGEAKTASNENSEEKKSTLPKSNSESVLVLEEKIKAKEGEIELLKEQVSREREINEDLKETLRTSQENQSKTLDNQKLIEDRTKEGSNIEVALSGLRTELSEELKGAITNVNKEKADLKKANIFYMVVIASLIVIAVVTFALWQSDIIPLN